jgi:hypothetical protein
MSNYWYTLTKKDKDFERRNVISSVASVEEIPNKVYQNLLEDKRIHLIDKLLINYHGSKRDIEALRFYLPSQYKEYADDLDRLGKQMVSLYEISEKYSISDIELAPNCYGCLYDLPGQKDHMECPTGCLHYASSYHVCS